GEGAVDDVAFLGLHAVGHGRMPVLDVAEAAHELPDFLGDAGSLAALLDLHGLRLGAEGDCAGDREQGEFRHTHISFSSIFTRRLWLSLWAARHLSAKQGCHKAKALGKLRQKADFTGAEVRL